MKDYINSIIDESIQTHNKFKVEAADLMISMASEIVKCFMNGGKVLICGNGGSAADAQHIAAEFVNRFMMERPPLPAIALTTDTSLITSIGNDYTFEEIFEKQVQALANPNDIVWGISTSGSSPNVVRALQRALKCDSTIIGFSGRDGGKMKGLCDHILIVDSKITARVQEIHILAAHIICGLVDEMMFGKFADR